MFSALFIFSSLLTTFLLSSELFSGVYREPTPSGGKTREVKWCLRTINKLWFKFYVEIIYFTVPRVSIEFYLRTETLLLQSVSEMEFEI